MRDSEIELYTGIRLLGDDQPTNWAEQLGYRR